MDTHTAPALGELAHATPVGRNRAIDFYRVVAMVFVAVGHWLVIAIGTDVDGEPFARNALEVAPQFGPVTWLFQVMPLFFAVGGFASAMSIDAHRRRAGSDGDWIVQRLRRLVAPTAVLAVVWLTLLAIAGLLGVAGLVAMGAVGAAIPLWFLANYTIDTALAPTMFTALRHHRIGTMSALFGSFLVVEFLHVVVGVPFVEHLNWVIGWLMFQTIGFLWRDGALPTGRRLLVGAAGLWAIAVAMVVFGPWSSSMIHVSGQPLSPTHPPSIALVVFGLAQTATAIAAAPAVTRWLERSRRSWSFVIAGNSMSMSVYLWHFTAAVAASALLHAAGLLPSASIGSPVWWIQKLPVILLSFALLVPTVAAVASVERRALLAERITWHGRTSTAVLLAVLLSTSIKLWSAGNVGVVAAGALGVLVVAVLVHRPARVSPLGWTRDRADASARTAA